MERRRPSQPLQPGQERLDIEPRNRGIKEENIPLAPDYVGSNGPLRDAYGDGYTPPAPRGRIHRTKKGGVIKMAEGGLGFMGNFVGRMDKDKGLSPLFGSMKGQSEDEALRKRVDGLEARFAPGATRAMKAGGKVRGCGVAQRGKTKGRYV